MAIQPLVAPNLPTSPLPFSPAIQAGDFLFVSGQASVDATGKIVNDTFEGEVRRSLDNVRTILTAAGLTFADVVQTRQYVARQEDLAQLNQLYREYFVSPFPARTTLIGCLGTMLKYEVDVVAYRPQKHVPRA